MIIKNISRLLLFIYCLILFHNNASAQYKNVKVWGAINSFEPQECAIVIDPSNTNNILAASNSNHYFTSTDAGLTWQHGVIHSKFGVVGDPSIAAGGNGKFFYFHLIPGLSRVASHTKNSIDETWTEGGAPGLNGTKQNDKDWGVVNTKNNYLYLTWSQFDKHSSSSPSDSSVIQLSRSTDEGITWSDPINISDIKGDAMGGNYSVHAPMPCIGVNSDVYVTWMGPKGLMFDKSTDAGLTWMANDINVTGHHINWLTFNVSGVQRTPNFPVIACDLSGNKYNGNIYITWADQRSGSRNTDVWLCKSTDGGITWSEAIRVNNQDNSPGAHQFFPWVTIDQVTGFVYCVFYDRAGYSNNSTDVTLAFSKDGGETFTSVKISESPFTPTQNDFIGDYIGISAHNNVIRPIWTRVDNGNLSLWTAIVETPTRIDDEDRNNLTNQTETLSIYPNPFNSFTTIIYSVEGNKPIDVKIVIYDILGKNISIPVDGELSPGKYSANFNAGNLPSGIYICELNIDGVRIEATKMYLIK